MISLLWLFVGVLVGLLMVSVFIPPVRESQDVPTPDKSSVFFTKTGCVKFKTTEVPCSGDSKSLNFIASTQ